MLRRVSKSIQIRGAGTHNLRDVDVDLPLGKLVVISGVSGSGKSSLAFDTLFAEGQRRYLEGVSSWTKSLLRQLPRPTVADIRNLPPTVSVDQRVSAAPIRSTLAVTTEIYDYLRVLYARAGTGHCTSCGDAVISQSVDEIQQRVLQLPERSKLMVLSPLVRARRGAHKDVVARISRHGFVRARVDGELVDAADIPSLTAQQEHTIEAVIDRLIVKPGIEHRLRESIELAVRESDGTCVICVQTDDGWSDRFFSTRFSCPTCDLSFPTPEPRTFSFNSAWGACPDCEGFGVRGIVDDEEDITVFRQAACESCGGSRLKPFARAITFLGQSIASFTAQSVADAGTRVDEWMSQLSSLPGPIQKVAARTLPDIRARLNCLAQVGIGYLPLDRVTRTLSGGEFQRARLAACLGTGLHGACYILDEPTSGLHPRDTQRLLETLQEIRDSGATVIVVEHDRDIIRAADELVDVGPGAGTEGGRIVFQGTPVEAQASEVSVTGKHLQPIERQATAADSPNAEDAACLAIRGAQRNNLRNIDVQIPLQKMVCVTGVSGSGKSSLIMDTLLPVAEAAMSADADFRIALADAECGAIDGFEKIQRVVAVDRRPLSRNRRSCIATFSGLWTDVRKLLTKTRDARARGFKAGRFSFNSGDGRCGACKGTGVQDIRMPLLPNATIPCSSCHGSRFNKATLRVCLLYTSPSPRDS